jgi:hypothetical protein
MVHGFNAIETNVGTSTFTKRLVNAISRICPKSIVAECDARKRCDDKQPVDNEISKLDAHVSSLMGAVSRFEQVVHARPRLQGLYEGLVQ